MPGQIDELEQKMAAVQEEISDPAFYQRPIDQTSAVLARLEQMQAELDVLVERWAELDS
ncbi:ABC transporter ATPase component [compost metagenome]